VRTLLHDEVSVPETARVPDAATERTKRQLLERRWDALVSREAQFRTRPAEPECIASSEDACFGPGAPLAAADPSI
jgi:hypothetical protein